MVWDLDGNGDHVDVWLGHQLLVVWNTAPTNASPAARADSALRALSARIS
jgi:hypothetical protein